MGDPAVLVKLDMLLEIARGFDARFRALELEIADVRKELRADIAEHRAETRAQVAGIQARLDDQSRMLAAMIPTQLAAVPARSAA